MGFKVGQLVRLDPNGTIDSIYYRLLSEGPVFTIIGIDDEYVDISSVKHPRTAFSGFFPSRFIPAVKHVYKRH